MFTATNLAQAGKRVAIVESRDWGGTTINRGSTPKKSILALAELHHQLEAFKGRGFDEVPEINWSDAMTNRDWIVQDEAARAKQRLIQAGVETFEASARFLDAHTISLGEETIRGEKIVLATGSKPRPLNFPGAQYVDDSGNLMRLHQRPDTIILIGAGIVAMSLISSFAEAGTEVHVVQYDDKVLKAFDEELVSVLVKGLEDKGVVFHMETEIISIEKLDLDRYQISLTNGQVLSAQGIYDVAGRLPNIASLDGDKAGLDSNQHGFAVNAHLQTNQPHIYALGDCCDAPVPKLSSYADYQAKYLAKALLSDRPQVISYPKFPASTVFSIPKIGMVGLSAKEAEQEPNRYLIKDLDMSTWQNYKRVEDQSARMKLIVNRADNRVLGAEILSHSADILINYLAILLNANLSMQDVQDIIFAYPSLATDLYGLWT